jgi:hypothetical protein
MIVGRVKSKSWHLFMRASTTTIGKTFFTFFVIVKRECSSTLIVSTAISLLESKDVLSSSKEWEGKFEVKTQISSFFTLKRKLYDVICHLYYLIDDNSSYI